jgi:hypothetical protein
MKQLRNGREDAGVMGLDELRRAWQQAVDDHSPGVSPHDVIERRERKYQALVDAAGEPQHCALRSPDQIPEIE